MYYLKKTFLAAVMAVSSSVVVFPVSVDEPAGMDTTIAEAGASDMSEDSSQEIQGTSAPREFKDRRITVVNEGKCTTQGPGAQKGEKEEAPAPKETSLGRFATIGYCGYEQCPDGHNLTLPGTVPIPSHTISTDLDYSPFGTRLKANDIVYTVGDKGFFVSGNTFDIFYGPHEEALTKDTYIVEVFLVQD